MAKMTQMVKKLKLSQADMLKMELSLPGLQGNGLGASLGNRKSFISHLDALIDYLLNKEGTVLYLM